jgi:threonine/homoserine/homoserine lactone efflux protein
MSKRQTIVQVISPKGHRSIWSWLGISVLVLVGAATLMSFALIPAVIVGAGWLIWVAYKAARQYVVRRRAEATKSVPEATKHDDDHWSNY